MKLAMIITTCAIALSLAGCDNGAHQIQQLKLQLDETQATANEARQKIEKLEAKVDALEGRIEDLEPDSSGPT